MNLVVFSDFFRVFLLLILFILVLWIGNKLCVKIIRNGVEAIQFMECKMGVFEHDNYGNYLMQNALGLAKKKKISDFSKSWKFFSPKFPFLLKF